MTGTGRQILIPFRRDGKGDFASGVGDDLLASKIREVLLTRPGELPWRTAFGAELDALRHQRNDAVLEELARVRVREALQRWVPGVTEEVDVTAQNETLVVRVQLGQADVDVRVPRV